MSTSEKETKKGSKDKSKKPKKETVIKRLAQCINAKIVIASGAVAVAITAVLMSKMLADPSSFLSPKSNKTLGTFKRFYGHPELWEPENHIGNVRFNGECAKICTMNTSCSAFSLNKEYEMCHFGPMEDDIKNSLKTKQEVKEGDNLIEIYVYVNKEEVDAKRNELMEAYKKERSEKEEKENGLNLGQNFANGTETDEENIEEDDEDEVDNEHDEEENQEDEVDNEKEEDNLEGEDNEDEEEKGRMNDPIEDEEDE